MVLFLTKRLVAMLLTMLAVSVLVFVVLEISPGSVATQVLGPYSSPEQRQLWLAQHGYTAPLATRYLIWLGRVVTGDFGYSIRFKVPGHAVPWPRLANTALLGLTTFTVMIPLALILGVLAGMRAGSKEDRLISLLSILTTSSEHHCSTSGIISYDGKA
jgi:peptide/nickel transport system permease protein